MLRSLNVTYAFSFCRDFVELANDGVLGVVPHQEAVPWKLPWETISSMPMKRWHRIGKSHRDCPSYCLIPRHEHSL